MGMLLAARQTTYARQHLIGLLGRVDSVLKHYGPGPHRSGSLQSVHGHKRDGLKPNQVSSGIVDQNVADVKNALKSPIPKTALFVLDKNTFIVGPNSIGTENHYDLVRQANIVNGNIVRTIIGRGAIIVLSTEDAAVAWRTNGLSENVRWKFGDATVDSILTVFSWAKLNGLAASTRIQFNVDSSSRPRNFTLSSSIEDIQREVNYISKHLPGQHNQLDHAPKGRGVRLSGLDSKLRNKRIGSKKIPRVYKDESNKVSRIVLFSDGSKKLVRSAALAKLAYGSRDFPFANLSAARANGFVSLIQASFLKNEHPEVFQQILADAAKGVRYWDNELGKMVITRKKSIEDDAYLIADDEAFLDIESMSESELIAKYFSNNVLKGGRGSGNFAPGQGRGRGKPGSGVNKPGGVNRRSDKRVASALDASGVKFNIFEIRHGQTLVDQINAKLDTPRSFVAHIGTGKFYRGELEVSGYMVDHGTIISLLPDKDGDHYVRLWTESGGIFTSVYTAGVVITGDRSRNTAYRNIYAVFDNLVRLGTPANTPTTIYDSAIGSGEVAGTLKMFSVKHLGPGNHPSGSPQLVHGHGEGGAVSSWEMSKQDLEVALEMGRSIQKSKLVSWLSDLSGVDMESDLGRHRKIEVMELLAEKLRDDKDFQSLIDRYGEQPFLSNDNHEVELASTESVENTVALLVNKWAFTSGDHDSLSVAMQKAAADEFGLPDQRGLFDLTSEWKSVYAEHGVGLRAFVRAQYQVTQSELSRLGVKNVVLFRGLAWDSAIEMADGNGWSDLAQQPLSSYTWRYETARDFSRVSDYRGFVALQVPAERIFSTPRTGFGSLSEGELVVMSTDGMRGYVRYSSQVGEGPAGYSWDRKDFVSEVFPDVVKKLRLKLSVDELQENADWIQTLIKRKKENTVGIIPVKGGQGSGFRGHAGRPGKRGGSVRGRFYHGTREDAFEKIKEGGLKSGIKVKTTTGRVSKVYLSKDMDASKLVGVINAVMYSNKPYVYVIEVDLPESGEFREMLLNDPNFFRSYISKRGISADYFHKVLRYEIRPSVWAAMKKYMRGPLRGASWHKVLGYMKEDYHTVSMTQFLNTILVNKRGDVTKSIGKLYLSITSEIYSAIEAKKKLTIISVIKGGRGSGNFAPGQGRGVGKPGSGIRGGKLLPEKRVWQGKQQGSLTARTSLDRQAVGAQGEAIAKGVMEELRGEKFDSLSDVVANSPLDLLGDNSAVEVKTGAVGNAPKSQHWRITLGQMGKEETMLVRQMTPLQRKFFYKSKMNYIGMRKMELVRKLGRSLDKKFNPFTMGIILSPSGRAIELLARTGAKFDQDAVLVYSQHKIPNGVKSLYVDYSFKSVLPADRIDLETSLAAHGLQGWTWLRSGGTSTLRLVAVPQWGMSSKKLMEISSQLDSILSRVYGSAPKRVRPAWVTLMELEGDSSYDSFIH